MSANRGSSVKYYRLEELAALWLTPHTVRAAGSDDEDRIQKLNELKWNHENCELFWKKTVLAYLGAIEGQKLLPAIHSLLLILDDSKDFPSVDPDDPETHERYKTLTDIPLRDHSIRVAEKTIHFLKKHHPNYQVMIGGGILAALAHDIGVLFKSMEMASHPVNGAKWCQAKLGGRSADDPIIQAIRFHHAPKKEWPKNSSILPFMVCANDEVRELELNMHDDAAMLTKIQQTNPSPAAEAPEAPAQKEPPGEPPTETDQGTTDADATDNPFDETTDENPFGGSPEPDTSGQETPTIEESPATAAEPLETEPDETAAAVEWAAEAQSPHEATTKQAPKQNLPSRINVLERIAQRVTPIGFDAFVFEDKAYVKPKIIRDILGELVAEAGNAEFANMMGDFIDNLIAGYGFMNKQARLKFKGKTPPQKAYYFIFDRDQIPLPEGFEGLTPRDVPDLHSEQNHKAAGFLKKIVILEKNRS